jgi:acyl-CoA thioester hydrolase
MKAMPSEFRTTRRVEFADTDAAGLMHFSNFFRFMECTEHAYFRSLGLSIHATIDGHRTGWPRVHAECSFTQPLRFEDEVEIQLIVRELKTRSITYDFIFRNLRENETGETARGSMTTVCVRLNPETGTLESIPIPGMITGLINHVPDTAKPNGE